MFWSFQQKWCYSIILILIHFREKIGDIEIINERIECIWSSMCMSMYVYTRLNVCLYVSVQVSYLYMHMWILVYMGECFFMYTCIYKYTCVHLFCGDNASCSIWIISNGWMWVDPLFLFVHCPWHDKSNCIVNLSLSSACCKVWGEKRRSDWNWKRKVSH